MVQRLSSVHAAGGSVAQFHHFGLPAKIGHGIFLRPLLQVVRYELDHEGRDPSYHIAIDFLPQPGLLLQGRTEETHRNYLG